MAYTTITMNLQGAQTRREWLENREYLVVPAVMMGPGVHQGNQGKLLYTDEECGKTPAVWNYKPVTLFHPNVSPDNPEGTACSPDVIERQKVGVMMNTAYPGKLKTECWLDEPKMRQSEEGTDILNKINNGEMVEISTGLYHDPDPTPGVWNGEAYSAIVRNIRPDHLALLPGQTGAFSIVKGGGLLRNANGEELSFDDVREQLRGLLRSKDCKTFGPCLEEDSDFVWVSDIFPKYAIVEKGGKVYKVGYKLRKGKVTIEETEPEEVRKVTTYVTANGQTYVTTNEDQQGPIKSIPAPKESDVSDPLKKRQQFDSTLKENFSGIQQEGDWGGWTTDLFANYAIFSKDGKHFRLPYTYDDDKIDFGDNGFEEVERVSEYRRKNGTPIDGTTSPPSSTNAGSVMNTNGTTKPLLANQVKKQITITGDLKLLESLLANQAVQNAIHQGAHAVFHDPGTHTEGANAHHPAETGKSDSQVRTTVAGARKNEVNSMISGGHAMEKDRSYLEGLPDDHFESVKTFAMKGATLPITQYSYEGIGDRSNAPGGTHNADPLTSWLTANGAPKELFDIVGERRTKEQQLRTRCIQIIRNKAPQYNQDWLQSQPTPALRGMAMLAAPPQQPQQPSTHNFGGQGDIPMFVDLDPATLQNQNQVLNNGTPIDDDTVLGLPGVFG